ncbi:MAG: hypothetical protein HQL03_00170 [Nitrospirae bacterium]|nr:hypothetical protein [Nitrospirota bacterium]MBF0591160.1 hypothetical protein [Nitrospirota bacterium]
MSCKHDIMGSRGLLRGRGGCDPLRQHRASPLPLQGGAEGSQERPGAAKKVAPPPFLCLLSLVLLLLFAVPPVVDGAVIYFYSPELNVESFSSLKTAFDNYLSRFGDYQFQPFKDKETFERHVSMQVVGVVGHDGQKEHDGQKGAATPALKEKDGILLVSSWYYLTIKGSIKMHPVMVGLSKGRSVQKRVLVASKKVGSIDKLRGGKLAASGTQEYNRELLRQILGDKKDISDSVRILTVPKDIDALMSLGFGLADYAITTDNSLEKLPAINQEVYNTTIKLLQSDDIMLPVILISSPATVRGDSNNFDSSALLTIIEKMGNDPEGAKIMKMLGLDKLKRLSQSEIKALE